ncbi:MAG: class IV adenylate cyclase [Chitinophagales bacterium]
MNKIPKTHLNIEIKARCNELEKIKVILQNLQADFKGIDHQIDTYFNCIVGRLKLREGNIERNLIHYNRPDGKQPKASIVTLEKVASDSNIKAVLTNALGVKIVVDKHRAIYFIDNVKFHLDRVADLGSFVEIEAIDVDGSIGKPKLEEQCAFYMDLFGIEEEDLVRVSYSDLLSNFEC